MKIALACVLIVCCLLVPLGWRWLVGEEDLSGITLVIWPIAGIGIALGLLLIARELAGSWRSRRHPRP